jgi:phenylacetate-coenzyme A ligase PaaK-like adenylate-forming protein
MTVTAKAHELLSRNLLLPLWHAQRLVRPSRRAVAAAIRDGLRFRRATEAWGDEQKRQWILERLRFTARRAYRDTPHYRELFFRAGFDPFSDFSFDDFARLPVLERNDIREAGPRLISCAVPSEQLKKDATGGSTGTPTEVWIGPEEMGWKESGGEYFMRRIGAPTGTRTAMLWGHHLDPTGRDNWRERYHAFESNCRWFDCLRLGPETLERYHREFARWQPACIVAYASAVGHLAEYVLERGYAADYPARCFVTGAEKLLPDHRAKIAQAFGRPVHERYGGRDVGYIAFQMRPETSFDYEVDWANVLVEPETDETESSILITKLHADGMPMIRYRVGDIGRFPHASRPGHPALALHEIIGRDTDRIWLPDGRWITGLQIPHMMKDYPVQEYMFTQRRDYSVEIKVVPKTHFSDHSRRQILGTVQANLPGLQIALALVDEIPRTRANKWRPVVSEVPGPLKKTA